MKKDETRFTIRFNPSDPKQKKAMDVLEGAGRRKASLIADALCDYLARVYGEPGGVVTVLATPSPYSPPSKPGSNHSGDFDGKADGIKPCLNDVVITDEIGGDDDTRTVDEETSKIDVSNNEAFDLEMQATILGGLSSFSQHENR